MLYRPSADSVNCPDAPSKWLGSDRNCYNGFAQAITFNFATGKVQVPQLLTDNVVWTVAYNTTHYGFNPVGESAACYTSSGGCGYDSLSVGAERFDGSPYLGTDVQPDGAFVDSTSSSSYCDLGGTGTLRLDIGDGSCWTGYTPLAEIATTQPKTH